MRCDFCPEKATVFLTQLVDNEVKKMCLCESCAEEKGVSDPTGFSLADVLLGGGKVPESGEIVNLPEGGPDQVCPSCGFTLAKFQQVGRLGCSDCYTTFQIEITSRLKGMHKGVKHRGRVPEHLADAHHRQQQLDTLNQQLEEAIRAENYEEAAGLRDRIAEIQAEATVES
jgi:protein arginine kinase activator